ncbi:mechanosensitive ion channel family protein [Brevibacterium album]|uniref:mechanosensitive ion channel family protein n=1 Tax=Brevibacterium album TaxID=417948 RepID=UPI00040ED138|nr:mechanosensitive ion channel family protein [Brevibacterium album]
MATQTATPTSSPTPVPDPSGAPSPAETISVEEVQRVVEDSASSGWEFLLGTPLRVTVILLVAIVITFVVRRLIRKFAKSIATGGSRRKLGETKKKSVTTDFLKVDPSVRERRAQRANTVGSLLQSIATIVIWLITGMTVLTELGFNLAPVLASAGIAGLALGFGAQTLVKDYLAGFFIVIEDQYGIGDYIDAGEAEGTVEEVGLRTTKLRGLDGTLWHVRNGEILRVGNYSQGWGQVVLDLPFPYDTDEAAAETVIRDVFTELRKDPEVDRSIIEEPEVLGIQDITGEAVTVRALIKTTPGDQFAVGRQFRAAFKRQLTAHGLAIPWTQQTVLRTSPAPSPADRHNQEEHHGDEAEHSRQPEKQEQ